MMRNSQRPLSLISVLVAAVAIAAAACSDGISAPRSVVRNVRPFAAEVGPNKILARGVFRSPNGHLYFARRVASSASTVIGAVRNWAPGSSFEVDTTDTTNFAVPIDFSSGGVGSRPVLAAASAIAAPGRVFREEIGTYNGKKYSIISLQDSAAGSAKPAHMQIILADGIPVLSMRHEYQQNGATWIERATSFTSYDSTGKLIGSVRFDPTSLAAQVAAVKSRRGQPFLNAADALLVAVRGLITPKTLMAAELSSVPQPLVPAGESSLMCEAAPCAQQTTNLRIAALAAVGAGVLYAAGIQACVDSLGLWTVACLKLSGLFITYSAACWAAADAYDNYKYCKAHAQSVRPIAHGNQDFAMKSETSAVQPIDLKLDLGHVSRAGRWVVQAIHVRAAGSQAPVSK